MLKAKKANVILQIDKTEMQRYLDMGYNTFEDGKLVAKAIPTDLGVLQKHYVESEKRIAELEAELKAYTHVIEPLPEEIVAEVEAVTLAEEAATTKKSRRRRAD